MLKVAADIVNVSIEDVIPSKVKWTTLGDISSKIDTIKFDSDEASYKYIDLSSVDRVNNIIVETTEINKSNAPSRAKQIIKKDDILFGGTRPMLRRFAYIEEEFDGQIASTGFTVLRISDKDVLSKFIYYQIQTDKYFKYIENIQKGASYPAVTDAEVKNYKISIPPLMVQAHIVSILDKFDVLTNNITKRLSEEIELRNKQYEYYREKILTFK